VIDKVIREQRNVFTRAKTARNRITTPRGRRRIAA